MADAGAVFTEKGKKALENLAVGSLNHFVILGIDLRRFKPSLT